MFSATQQIIHELSQLPWDLSDAARTVVRTLKNKKNPDLRFRPSTIKGQMQDIYLATRDELGISLKAQDLMTLWQDAYFSAYKISCLEKKIYEHQRLINSTRKRLKLHEDALQELQQPHEV